MTIFAIEYFRSAVIAMRRNSYVLQDAAHGLYNKEQMIDLC